MVVKKLSLSFLIPLLFILSGCEKFLDYEGEDANPKLVLNGIFSADSVFSVELSNSQGYVSNGQLNTLTNGKVAVFDQNGNLIDSLFHQNNGVYTSNAIAEANVIYEVRASAGNFGTISASDLAPSPVAITNLDTSSVSVTEFDYTTTRLQVDFTIIDPSNIENYYIIEVYRTDSYYLDFVFDPLTGMTTWDTLYYEEPNSYLTQFSTSDAILTSDVDLFFDETLYYTNSLAFTDALIDGNSQTFRISLETYDSQQGSILELRLTSCSESYYKYKRTLENYFYTEGDPFAQPVQVYSNIQDGGFGIWAGGSSSSAAIGD